MQCSYKGLCEYRRDGLCSAHIKGCLSIGGMGSAVFI